MSVVKFSKLFPLPAYTGPVPVYRCSFGWAGAVDCLVRKNGDLWETAEVTQYLHQAKFGACPTGDASQTRYAACMAFDYYFNRSQPD